MCFAAVHLFYVPFQSCKSFCSIGLLETMEKNGFSAAGNTEESTSRKRTRSEGRSTSGASIDDDYTKEQVEAVER